MDPDANLAEQLRLARRIQAEWDQSDTPPEFDPTDVARLADLVLALHGWIIRGGFLPLLWRKR